LIKHAAATLGSGNLRLAVMLPEGGDINEWVAVNSMYIYIYYLFFNILNFILINLFILAVDFFNQINMLYGTITEFCTDQTCPIMSAGAKYK
jgi:MOB kinase activator 1